MGTVYHAHRDDGQFRHEVAVKVLRGSLRSSGIASVFCQSARFWRV
jgi:hypothetical protein